MRTISQRELRNDSGRVLRDLQSGEQVMVSISGTVIGILRMDAVPEAPQQVVDPERRRRALAGLTPLTGAERERWRADIDATPDPLDDPWERS